ncbi:Helicase associated domain protein, partial [Sphaerisporangium sp. NPDC051017]|uniref:DEAD/DEAH box helicase n=1 Tax=Sphaerisporangium sp. NPDC051017 TaxID=3154636 RepID=UPI003445CA48
MTAVEALYREIATGGRARLTMACGTGKTLTGAGFLERIGCGRSVVFVPTLELIAQTARAYADYLGSGTGVMAAVCSDPSVMIEAARINASLGALTAGITTSPDVLAGIMRRWDRLTVFCTYQSQSVVSDAQARGAHDWDLMVVDEAHLSAGHDGKKWSGVTRDDYIRASRRIFMTATPRILEAADAVSMDDDSVYGNEVYHLSFGEAIKRRLVADYQVVVPFVTTDEVLRAMRGRPVVKVGAKPVSTEMLAGQIALLKAARQYGLRRVITYHSRVAGAKQFAATLPSVAELLPGEERPAAIDADVVSGTMSLDKRYGVLSRLEQPGEKTVIVSNARVLGLGVDVPELDAIMFADARNSVVDIVQAIGRVVRLGDTRARRKVATIIVPIVLAEGETPDAALQGSKFDPVWEVLRALRAHDSRVTNWLDSARNTVFADSYSSGSLQLPPWLHLVGSEVDPNFGSAITVRIVRAISSGTETYIAAAGAYHAKHGDLEVPAAYVTQDGVRLGRWIASLRGDRRSRLSTSEVRALDALGMRWEPMQRSRVKLFKMLREYHLEHGTCEVPGTYSVGDFRLGKEIVYLRTLWRAGSLSSEEDAELKRLGFRWEVGPWERGMKAARDFYETNKHLRVPYDYKTATGFRLYAWAKKRRTDRRNGSLSETQISELDQLGFVWDTPWERGVRGWEELRKAGKHHHIPTSYRSSEGVAMHRWVANRRLDRQRGRLTKEQIAELDASGFIWATPWERGLQAVQRYVAEHGDLDVPVGYQVEGGLRLDVWVATQRTKRARGVLTAKAINELTKHGFTWGSGAGGLDDLIEFHAKHGHLRVSRKARKPGERDLVHFLVKQRRLRRQGRLS